MEDQFLSGAVMLTLEGGLLVLAVWWAAKTRHLSLTRTTLGVVGVAAVLLVTGLCLSLLSEIVARQFAFFGTFGERLQDVARLSGHRFSQSTLTMDSLSRAEFPAICVSILAFAIFSDRRWRVLIGGFGFFVMHSISARVAFGSELIAFVSFGLLLLLSIGAMVIAAAAFDHIFAAKSAPDMLAPCIRVARWSFGGALVFVIAWVVFGLRLPFDLRVRLSGFTALKLDGVFVHDGPSRGELRIPTNNLWSSPAHFVEVLGTSATQTEETLLKAKTADLSGLWQDSRWRAMSRTLASATDVNQWAFETGKIQVSVSTHDFIFAPLDRSGELVLSPRSGLLSISVEEVERREADSAQPTLNVFLQATGNATIRATKIDGAALICRTHAAALGRVVGLSAGAYKMEKVADIAAGVPEVYRSVGTSRRKLDSKDANPLILQFSPALVLSLVGNFGELAIPDARAQYESVFQVGSAVPFKGAEIHAKGGFIRMGFRDPITLQPGDTIQMNSSSGMIAMRMDSGEVSLEGSIETLRLNGQPFNNTVWGQIDSGTQHTVIGLVIGILVTNIPRARKWVRALPRRILKRWKTAWAWFTKPE